MGMELQEAAFWVGINVHWKWWTDLELFPVFHNLGHINCYGLTKCLKDIASFFAS